MAFLSDTQDDEAQQGQDRASLSPTPRNQAFDLAKADDLQAKDVTEGVGNQISAADYDPSLDRREDEKKRVGPAAIPILVEAIEEEVLVEVEEEEAEEDDVDDMFAVDLEPSEKVKKVKKVKQRVVSVLFFFRQTCYSCDLGFRKQLLRPSSRLL